MRYRDDIIFRMRKPVIAGNWKMFKLLQESVDAALQLKPLVANANHCDVVIAPVFTALKTVADRLEGSNIQIAAQDCAIQNDFGAHTGEVAPVMLKDAGSSHRTFGASAVLRRDGRIRKLEDDGDACGGPDGDRLRRRKARGTGRGKCGNGRENTA